MFRDGVIFQLRIFEKSTKKDHWMVYVKIITLCSFSSSKTTGIYREWFLIGRAWIACRMAADYVTRRNGEKDRISRRGGGLGSEQKHLKYTSID